MTRAEWKIERSDRQPSARRGLAAPDRRERDEVAQRYVRDQASSGVRPIKTLPSFRQVPFKSRANRDVPLAHRSDAFRPWNAETRKVVALGWASIPTSPNSRDIQPVVLEIA